MELTLNEQGQLVDADGDLVEIEGEAPSVVGVKRQEDVDAAFQREQRKHKDKLDELTEQIEALEAQAGRTEEVQRLLDDMKAEQSELQQKLAAAERDAEKKVATQMGDLTKRIQELEENLDDERAGRVRDQVGTAILTAAKDRFNDPGTDLFPHFLEAHRREPKRDPDTGEEIKGEFVDAFRLTFKGEDDKEVSEYLPLDKALDVWADQHTHHVRPSDRGGSGGGQYVNTANLKRSQMSAADKAAFVDRHGREAFQALPQ